MIRLYQEARRCRGKKAGMYRVRLGVECVFHGADPEGKIPVSVLPLRDHLAQAAKRFAGSRAAAALLSAAMTWAVYRYCAALAWLERGGKTAYGGEYLVALLVGFFTWQAVRRWWGKG